ncbi:MAG: ComEC/Rec2 family competence protein [bacterium]
MKKKGTSLYKRYLFVSVAFLFIVFLFGFRALDVDISRIRVYVFDVGQGDSILIKAFDRNLLIDAGPEKDLCLRKLEGFGVKRLNLVIATHPHSDHIGGMKAVVERYLPEYYMDPGVPYSSKIYKDLLSAIKEKKINYLKPKGQTIHIEEAILFVFPLLEESDEMNNNSVISRLSYNNFSMLFLGDSEREEQSYLINVYRNELKSDIVKIAHHGSSTGTSKELLDAVMPKIGIISVGRGNSYGHPHKETITLLMANKVKIYRTDEDGTVAILSDGNGYMIIRENGPLLERLRFIFLQGKEFLSGIF